MIPLVYMNCTKMQYALNNKLMMMNIVTFVTVSESCIEENYVASECRGVINTPNNI